LPSQTRSLWRDIKVIGHYAYIGSESPGHRIQVFDLLKVRIWPGYLTTISFAQHYLAARQFLARDGSDVALRWPSRRIVPQCGVPCE
jgi:hypothetical protein